MRQVVVRRRASFEKAGVTGYAYNKLLEDVADIADLTGDKIDIFGPVVQTARDKRTRQLSQQWQDTAYTHQRLVQYISLLQGFLQSKTGTVEGWKKYTLEQDKYLFGKKGRGAAYRMTDEERRTFFQVWEELKVRGWSPVSDYYSLTTSGFAKVWQEDRTFSHTNLEEAFQRMNRDFGSMLERLRENRPAADGGEGSPFPPADGLDGDGLDDEFHW